MNQGSLGKCLLSGQGQGKIQNEPAWWWQEVRKCSKNDGARRKDTQANPRTCTATNTKIGGQGRMTRNRCLRPLGVSLGVSPNSIVTTHKGTVTLQKPGGLSFTKGARLTPQTPDVMQRRTNLTFCTILPKMHNFNQSKRKPQINPNWGTFHKVTG